MPGLSISYFPDGRQMVSASRDGTTRRWDLEVGKEIEEARDVCTHWEEVHSVAVSRDGKWVVMGGRYGRLRVYEVETGVVRTFQGNSRSQEISCIDISVDSTLLASGYDSTVRIWSLETVKVVAGPFRSINKVGAVRFSQDSKKIAVMSHLGKCLEVWDVQTQHLDVRLGEAYYVIHRTSSAPVFWTTGDKTIVAAFSFKTISSPNTIYEFDASTLETVGTPFKEQTNTINGLALSFDCALLASASNDNTIKLWAFESRQLLAVFDVLNPHYLIFSPNSRKLVYTAGHDSRIYLCSTQPEILASIQPAKQGPKTSAPVHTPLADLPNVWSLPQDLLYTLGGPALDLPGAPGASVIALPPPSPVLSSRLPESSSYPYDVTPTVLRVRDHDSSDLPPEARLRNLTGYITKDGDYPVARGGFGEIWKCTYHNDQRLIKVAVKALHVYAADQLGVAKTKKLKRINHELRICANLEHKNILPVYGYTKGFGPFIALVSPWAENGNLTAYLEREGADITLVRRFQVLKDIIAGLQYLHANSVIHGDFNGPNVLIHGDGTACVADFGLSLMYSEVISASQASWTSTLKGNARWMAPELLEDRDDGSQVRPSKQSDMYSFGGIMLQVLTNKIPYHHLSNDAAIILCIAKSQTPSRSRYTPLPDKYWEFIEQCWSTDPRDRPSTKAAGRVIRNEYHALSRSS
ncbi:kinase-like domain-containing protein [Suillus clintonianus]|uniref:kinase-like domain-containing protein n=1 Tax=Suillus clintonianus TaxID=1904413 RepID=UPI001B86AD2B|nr:kinase-like domain-containing protein [Suillus clintonianus]KAG2128968.1 kinase-like domain-containing protein [Suillus clintonianus]